MKKFIPFLSIAFLMAACSSKPETETKTLQSANQAMAPTDTAGLAQFQQWKAQNELSVANNAQSQQQPAVVEPQVQTKTIVREVVVERPAPTRRQQTRATSQAPVSTPPPVSRTEESSAGNTGPESAAGTGTGTAGTTGTTEAPAPTQETAKKEGWSKAAKGAAIGGAGGAVIGAVISKKNPAVGAAIGGVLGGAVGYGIGRSKDKKDGRY